MQTIIIDGPWASGKSIIKGILDGHNQVVTCLHQEPIFSAEAFKDRLNSQQLIKLLKLDELNECYKNNKIGWWFREGDKVEIPFKWDPTELIEKIVDINIQNVNLVDIYIDFILKIKSSRVEKIAIMEDFMRDKKIYKIIKRRGNYKILICDRECAEIVNDILWRNKEGLLKSFLKKIKITFMVHKYYLIWRFRGIFDENIKFIKFSEITSEKQSVIDEISKFLNIIPSASLYSCTFDGVVLRSNKGVEYL